MAAAMGQRSGSAMLVFLGTVGMLLLTCRGTTATSFLVGDSQWTFQTNLTFYSDWAQGQSFEVGDSLEFQYTKSIHNVTPLTSQSAFDNCDSTGAVPKDPTGDTVIPVTTPGTKWYICSIPGHCDLGMKIQLTVTGASGAPAPGASAPGAPFTDPTGAPAPTPYNAAPRLASVIGYGTAAAVMVSAASFFL